MRDDRRPWAPSAIAAVLALGLYAVTLGGTYIYDDAFLISIDPRVHSPKLWYQFWTQDWFHGGLDNLYRPLVSQSFGLQMWLHGDRPWAFHLVNVLLHAGGSALVAELGRRLGGWKAGLIAGLLFAAHPVHSEAVAGIVGRAELACTVCVLGAMLLFLKRPMTTKRAVAIGLVSLAAMLSKEQGLLLPALLAMLIPVRARLAAMPVETAPPLLEAERQATKLAFALVVWFAGGLIFLREEVLKLRFEWTAAFLNVAIQPLAIAPTADRWLIPLALVGRYFLLLLAPVKLSIDYGLAVIGPTIGRGDPYLWLGAVVVAAWTAATVVLLVRRRWVAFFCMAALALTYAPAANVLMIATIFGERLMYLPSVFFVLLLAMALVRLPAKAGNWLVIAVVALGCVRTWTYVARWNDRDAFYRYSAAEQPRSLQIHLLLASVDYEEGNLAEARRIASESEQIYGDYWQCWKLSALIEQKSGNWAQAEIDWKRAFDLYPTAELNAQWAHAMRMSHEAQAATRK